MNDLLKGTGLKSVSRTPDPPDYNELSSEDKQRFDGE